MPGMTMPGRGKRGPEAGYVLLVLLLFMSLMVIAALAVAPSIAVAIQRDREEELIHRGVQYTRSIRKFTRKFGHYPANLEELQSSNGQRFLRRKYTDPITGKDFKLLHFADVQLSNGPGVASFTQGLQAPTGSADSAVATAIGGTGAEGAQPPPDPSDPGAAPGSDGANTGARAAQESPLGQGAPSPAGLGSANGPGGAQSGGPSPLSGGSGVSQFGAGAILGVASTSKHKSFHEFDRKNRYSDWKFYYDPGFDRGFPITGPTVRPTLSGGPAESVPGVVGTQQQPGVQQPAPGATATEPQ